MKTRCALEIKGIKHVKKIRGNMIIASNHLSEMDALLIVSCMPFFSNKLPFIYVGRQKELYSGPLWKRLLYGGTFFKIIGAYPAYKGLGDYALSLPHHFEVIKRGHNVAIFPYGRIIKNNEEATARGGVTFMAVKANLPIVPLKITGTQNLTFKSFYSGKRKITFTFGKPLYPKDVFKNAKKIVKNKTRNDYQDAAAKVMEEVNAL